MGCLCCVCVVLCYVVFYCACVFMLRCAVFVLGCVVFVLSVCNVMCLCVLWGVVLRFCYMMLWTHLYVI